MDILSDASRRAERKANLEQTAQLTGDMLNERLRRKRKLVGAIIVDKESHDVMFGLYLSRVKSLKSVANMEDALINAVKIAALTALCILDTKPLLSSSEAQSAPIAAYRNAYLALRVALNFLLIRQSLLPRDLELLALDFLTHVNHVEEATGSPRGSDYSDFARRFTLLMSYFHAITFAHKHGLTGQK